MDDNKVDQSSSFYEVVTEIIDSCEICYGSSSSSSFVRGSCGHIFCKKCFSEYFESRWEDNSIFPLKCPRSDCNNDVYKGLSSILDKDNWKKFKAIRKRRKLLRDPTVKWCPVINCEGFGRDDGKSQVFCNLCEKEISVTESHERQDALDNFSVIECPGCSCLITRTFGCMKMTCYCGASFCMKCGSLDTGSHSYWLCIAKDKKNEIPCWIPFFTLFIYILAPLIPAFVIYFYRNMWDKNYIRALNDHPWVYAGLIIFFSPMILVFSLFYLPFVFGWYCMNAMFDGKSRIYKKWWILLKILLYFPSVLLTFIGFLLLLSLVVAFLPLYGLAIVGYMIFKVKSS